MKSSYTLENLTAAFIAALWFVAESRPVVEGIALKNAAYNTAVVAGYDEDGAYIVRVSVARMSREVTESNWGRICSALETALDEPAVFVEFA